MPSECFAKLRNRSESGVRTGPPRAYLLPFACWREKGPGDEGGDRAMATRNAAKTLRSMPCSEAPPSGDEWLRSMHLTACSDLHTTYATHTTYLTYATCLTCPTAPAPAPSLVSQINTIC